MRTKSILGIAGVLCLLSLLGAPVVSLLTPLLWMVVLAITLVVIIGLTPMLAPLTGLAVALISLILGLPLLSQPPLRVWTMGGLFVVGLLSLLTLTGHVLALRPRDSRLPKPAVRRRLPEVTPMRLTDPSELGSPETQSEDDLGLFADGEGI